MSAQLSTAQLRQALQLREQIDSLQAQLDSLFNGGPATAPAAKKSAVAKPKGKRTISPEARARIAAGAQARWDKIKGKTAQPASKPAPAAKAQPKKGGLTPEGREKLAAAMKARWAAKKNDQ